MSEPSLTKPELRRAMMARRSELAARDPDAGERIATIFPMKLFERYGPSVSGYLSIGSEIDAGPLMERLARSGAELSLPRLEPDGGMTFRSWSHGEPLERGPFGLSEPPPDAPLAHPGLVLAPLLAFDQAGHRLGYGKGYYDRALTPLRAAGPVFVCALAFHGQMVETVPHEPHDQPLDWALTERGSVPLFMMRGFAEQPDDPGPSAA